MSTPYYPKVDLTALAAILTIHQQALVHENYLDGATCPYDTKLRESLATLLGPVLDRGATVREDVDIDAVRLDRAGQTAEGGGAGRKLKTKASGVDLDGVSGEIQALRKELQQLKTDSKGLQTNDRIQIIKTRAGLVEKLVAMDERTNNLKRQSQFQTVLLGILDDLVPPERRLEFLKRVAPFAAEEVA